MTPCTLFRGLNLVLVSQVQADIALCPALSGLPVKVRHLGKGPQVVFGFTMTIETPPHAQALVVRDDLHLVHMTVAAHASHATLHMNGVIEEDIVGHLMNSNPRNRFAALEACLDRRDLGAIGLDRLVTAHAGLGGRYLRRRRIFDAGVAIKARETELAGVLSMRERDGLNRRIPHARVILRTVVIEGGQAEKSREKRADSNTAKPVIKPAGAERRNTIIAGSLTENFAGWFHGSMVRAATQAAAVEMMTSASLRFNRRTSTFERSKRTVEPDARKNWC